MWSRLRRFAGVACAAGVAGDDVTIGTILRGIVPFLVADFVKLALLVLFPIITLWLPATMR